MKARNAYINGVSVSLLSLTASVSMAWLMETPLWHAWHAYGGGEEKERRGGRRKERALTSTALASPFCPCPSLSHRRKGLACLLAARRGSGCAS